MRAIALVALVVALLQAAPPNSAAAQLPQQPVQTELRLDGLFARANAVQAGFGISVPAGIYVRTGLVAAAGAGERGAEGRLDFVSRFSLDPFRQSRWAPYGGAGVSGRFRPERAGGTRAYLLVFLGLEGPLPLGEQAGWEPAFEIGLGGGARVAIVLRKGVVARR